MVSRQTTRFAKTTGIFRFVFVVLSLLTIEFLNTSIASASCGDYLHSKSMRGHGQSLHHQHSPATATLGKQSSDAESPPQTCRGPQCQQRDPLPVAPHSIPTKMAPRTISEGHLAPTPEMNLVSRAYAYHEAAICASEGFRDRLDRPPRA